MTRPRYAVLDLIRGLALVNMVAYHAAWDLVYIFGVDWAWYEGPAAHLWQQAICCTFILLSGFCQPLGRQSYRRGLTVFLAGALVSAVTLIAMPDSRILFGVLTLLGSAMVLTVALGPLLRRCPPWLGLGLSLGLFAFFKRWQAPGSWHANYFTAFLGFPQAGFWSTDYFPLAPWLFLFWAGWFLHFLTKQWHHRLAPSLCRPLEWTGAHALPLYLAHQPVTYAILMVVFSLLNG